MPIYEYQCDECGHDFEELVMSSEETISCPSCHSEQVHKVMSGGQLQKQRKFQQFHRFFPVEGAPAPTAAAATDRPLGPDPMIQCGKGRRIDRAPHFRPRAHISPEDSFQR